MAAEGDSSRRELAVEPKYHGFFVQRKWYCDCLLEAKCRRVTKEGSEFLGKPFWSCRKVDKSSQCGMWTLDEDTKKARDWLAQYGPETPDLELFEKPKRERPSSPKTPPAKLNMSVNPFTRARARAKGKRALPHESSDEWVDPRAVENGEGGASRQETTGADKNATLDPSSSSRQDESDPPPAKRSRTSPTTPVPGAPRKKNAHVAFALPAAQSDMTARNLTGVFQAARRSERNRAPASPPPPTPVSSLPTPETGHRVKDFRIYEDKEDSKSRLRVDHITASQLAQLSSPINLDDTESELGLGYDTPTKKTKTRSATRGVPNVTTSEKGKEKASSDDLDSSQALVKSIMAILRSEGHTLKASTRYQIEHEIESILDVKDAKLKSCERTIGKLKSEADQLEETIELLTDGATVNGVIELSD